MNERALKQRNGTEFMAPGGTAPQAKRAANVVEQRTAAACVAANRTTAAVNRCQATSSQRMKDRTNADYRWARFIDLLNRGRLIRASE